MPIPSQHKECSPKRTFYAVGSMDSTDCLSFGSMLLSLMHREAERFAANLIFSFKNGCFDKCMPAVISTLDSLKLRS